MGLHDLPERLLQRAVHTALADPQRLWTCTNGDVLQVVAAGMPNVHAGPDFQDMAVLHNGVVCVGDGEFHKRASDWHAHAHTGSERYEALMMHVVLENDVPQENMARWTLVVSAADVREALGALRSPDRQAQVEVDELQHFALLRLLRLTADAQVSVRRLGVREALRAQTTSWLNRLMQKRHRPVDRAAITILRTAIVGSALGVLVEQLDEIPTADLAGIMERAEKQRIANEGPVMRREVLVNVVLPLLCARARHDQRVVLLQWYWSAQAVHPYGELLRRFPRQPQDFVWHQQGMLEHLRLHGRRISTCGEAIRAYGVSGTLDFIRASF
jgi:hypothetical protein